MLEGVELFPQSLLNVRLAPDVDWRSHVGLANVRKAVEVELGNQGRVLIRASGTEPVLRIMVEARDAGEARACADRMAAALA